MFYMHFFVFYIIGVTMVFKFLIAFVSRNSIARALWIVGPTTSHGGELFATFPLRQSIGLQRRIYEGNNERSGNNWQADNKTN